MKGKLLRGITGSVQPRRLLHGYQDAVFAWSGENPFANLAQSDLYRILPRTQYSKDWIKSTPHGQAFRANNYSDSGNGYVFSRHVPSADVIYAEGVTGYAEFVYSEDLQEAEYTQHLCCISSSADGNTGDVFNGVLTFGLEFYSGKGLCPFFRVGNNTTLYGFAGGSSNIGGGGSMVPVSIPVGTKVRQMVAFDPVSKAYATILTFNDSVYEESGTVPNGFPSTGSSILIGGYPRYGNRAAHVSGMLEAAIWNRGIPLAEMRALLERPSIFQPTEFIFPFSFGESSGNDVINTVSEAIVLSPIQAGLRTTEILNTQAETLTLSPVAAQQIEVGDSVINCATAPLTLTAAAAQQIEVGDSVISCATASLTLTSAAAQQIEVGDSVISCSTAALALSAAAAQQIEVGDSVISCASATLTLTASTAQQLEAGDSVISCSTASLTLTAAAAQQVEVGDSVIGCVSAALTLTAAAAQQVEIGDSVIGCPTAALTLTAAAAQQVEIGDSVIGCATASLTLTAAAAQQIEIGDSVIGCSTTSLTLDGTTATITDSMGARSAAVVLSTPGCSIHDFDIIGAGQAALVTGSSAAALVESGEAIIDTGYADIGIAAAQCGIVQTDAEPIITDIGLVASINQPTIYATIPRRTTTARV